MENVFNSLCSMLAEPELKALFVEAEGVELMIIMMKSVFCAAFCNWADRNLGRNYWPERGR